MHTPKSEPESVLQKTVLAEDFSGVIGVYYRDSVLFEGAYGFTQASRQIPNDVSTCFPLASVSKLFVKQAIMDLCLRKVFNGKDTLGSFLSGIPGSGSITLEYLLEHTSGLPDIHNENSVYARPLLLSRLPGIYCMLDSVRKLMTLRFQPGSRREYSNTNYLLLSEIIKKQFDTDLESYLDSTLFQKAGMHNTGFYKVYSPRPGHARGIIRWNHDWIDLPVFDFRYFDGSGNAYSTLHDLRAFGRFLKHNYPDSICARFVSQSGYYPGIRTFYYWLPEVDAWVIVLSNNGQSVEALTDQGWRWILKAHTNANISGGRLPEPGLYTGKVNGSKISVRIRKHGSIYSLDGVALIPLNRDSWLMDGDSRVTLKVLLSGDKATGFRMNDHVLLIDFTLEK